MESSRPIPDLSELLIHSKWLRQLVAPLLGGDAAVEDVLQETWLAALERPPQDRSRVRGWLARVAWKRAQRHRRDAARRISRETRAAKPELVPAADRVLAEVELQAQLANLILALDRPYRQVLLLRFYEGLPPRAIAAELSVPVATVKTWIRRGIERLRAALAAELGTDWRGALAPLVLPSVLTTSATSVGVLAASLAFFGAVMQTKTLIALALVSAVGAWLWIVSGEGVELASTPIHSSAEHDPLEIPRKLESEPEIVVREAEQTTLASTPNALTPEARELRVEILDDIGIPRRDVGVVVKLWQSFGAQGGLVGSELVRFDAPQSSDDPFLRIPVATIEECLATAQKAREQGAKEVFLRLQANAKLLGEPYVELQSVPPIEEPLRLAIAASGRLRIDLVDGAGARRHGKIGVLVRARSKDAFLPQEREWGSIRSASQMVNDGSALVPVPLGANLRIEVRDLDRVLAARALVIDGPTLRDEEIVVPIALTTTAPVLVGRLINEANKPLADSRFGLHIRVGRRTTVETITTDGEGHFELPWHPEFDGERLTEAFLIQQLGAGIEVVPNGPSARIPAPTIPATGRVELGAIVMRSPTLQAILAAGVVVDGEGRPIEGAHVLSYSIWPISAEGPWKKYSSLSDATVKSDADGRFRIVSGAPCRGLMIGAQKSGYYLERLLPCEVGRQDLKLVMRTGASLLGNVLLDPAVPRGRVEVQFLNARSRTLSTAQLDENGAFALQALRPTQGAVVVKLSGMLLLRIEGIEISGAGEQRNERLNDLDLRGKLREFRVRIIDSRGGPLESGRRVYLSSREVPTSVAFFMLDERGSGTTWIPASIESVILGAADYAPFEIAAYPDQRTVTLEKRHALVFELDPAVELPAEHHLRVALRLPEASEFSRIEQLLVNSSRDDLLQDAPVRRGVPHAGRYELHFWVRARLLDREEHVGVLPLEIPAEAGEHVMRVAPKPEDLANAIEKMR